MPRIGRVVYDFANTFSLESGYLRLRIRRCRLQRTSRNTSKPSNHDGDGKIGAPIDPPFDTPDDNGNMNVGGETPGVNATADGETE